MEVPSATPQGRFDPHEFANASTIASWLDSLPEDEKLKTAQEVFTELLQDAAQPRKSSSQACVKLCGFVQLCTRSKHDGVRYWAFEESTSMRLFDFYIEWNEHDQHRSMRLVLDVLTTTFLRNPDAEVGKRIKTTIMDTLVSIISRQSTRPLVKSSLHCVVHFMSKQAINLDDIAETYRRVNPEVSGLSTLELWKSLVAVMFSWTDMHYVCPIAGKFIVNVLSGLQSMSRDGSHPGLAEFGVKTWQEWIQDGLAANMERLESVKNYVITPLFTVDRPSSLELLKIYNQQSSDDALLGQWALLRLSVLEVGKKAGMVDEPGNPEVSDDKSATIALQSQVLESFLVHPTHVVRSSGLSLLVSSSSTTKPLSEETFKLLRGHLAAYYADHDAKFRNDILSFTKDLINRVKYVMNMASRSLVKAEAKPQQKPADGQPPKVTEKKKKKGTENIITDEKEAKEVLDRHAAFLKWYAEFLKGELIPTASYQRHITALKALLPVLKLGKHASGSDESLDMEAAGSIFTDSTSIRLLLDLLMDPFDDVRETAMSVLLMVPQDFMSRPLGGVEGNSDLLRTLSEFCNRAAQLASRTGRADHGNGAARAQGLLCSWLGTKEKRITLVKDTVKKLEAKLARAREDLGRAAMEDSVHGDFASLGYMWQILTKTDIYHDEGDRSLFGQLFQQIVSCCQDAWDIVNHVLCDDSPEGHLPEEMEDIEGLDTKDLLSYSFRAIHESSNVMRMIASGVGSWGPDSALIPPKEVFNTIGDLTFSQLAKLRHRGAFTTVSSTFTTCCQMTSQAPETYASDNLRRWYENAKKYIESLASTTRRSAGIPSLIIGVLAANSDSPSFDEVFRDLGEIAKRPALTKETDGSNLPQVHALNCLRGIFRTSLLSKRAEGYLPATLELAANSLKSEIWAIRNCGLLLLRSLIDCLFGTGESKHVTEAGWDGHTIRISYNKYPTLPTVLVGLLKSAGPSSLTPGLGSTGAAEAVFPVLDIVRRAGPPDEYREELFGYIKEYLGSQLWHVREIAARTLCSFLLGGGWIEAVGELINEAGGSANRLHGALLTVKFIVERKSETDVDGLLRDVLKLRSVLEPVLDHPTATGEHSPRCEEVLATYLEIQNLLLKIGSSNMNIDDPTDELPSNGEFSQSLPTIDSALLRLQINLLVVYETARNANREVLSDRLRLSLERDSNTACRMLEAVPDAWGPLVRESSEARIGLFNDFIWLNGAAGDHPGARALVLSFVKETLDSCLQDEKFAKDWNQHVEGLVKTMWTFIRGEAIHPSLSHVILELSGSVMAVVALQGKEGWGDMLRAWGKMIADALDIDNTFDTRFAAATGLESYLSATGTLCQKPEHLPALIALYDALNDDDDEVREVATRVTGIVTGETVTTLEASDRLLDWLAAQFGQLEEFRSVVVSRLAGLGNTQGDWLSAEVLLSRALDFDDSLFAEEEQNLFVDEVRESRRFLRVFRTLDLQPGEPGYERLAGWTAAGLKTLVQLAGEKEDGPLGWTSDQHVFAVCSGVLQSGVALRRTDMPCEVLLDRLVEVGGRSLHGSLLAMAEDA